MNGPHEGDRITERTECNSPATFQAENDLLDTMNGADPVRQAWRMGMIADPQALININRAETRKARILQAARAIGGRAAA